MKIKKKSEAHSMFVVHLPENSMAKSIGYKLLLISLLRFLPAEEIPQPFTLKGQLPLAVSKLKQTPGCTIFERVLPPPRAQTVAPPIDGHR